MEWRMSSDEKDHDERTTGKVSIMIVGPRRSLAIMYVQILSAPYNTMSFHYGYTYGCTFCETVLCISNIIIIIIT